MITTRAAQRTMLIRCANAACREQVVVSLDADRATCSRCGNQWPWALSKQSLKVTREAR